VIFATVVTLFCCLPLGVVALILAYQASAMQVIGKKEAARKNGLISLVLSSVGLAIGISLITAGIAYYIFGWRH